MTSVEENKKPAILLVDDEPEILNSLKGLLRREFTLFTAESGEQAIEILRQHAIHVIMTDQRMPEMTGAELLTRVGELSADSVRIIFTGYADIKAVVDAVNSGNLYRYITKPWDPDDLIATLHQAADEYARRRRHRSMLGEMKQILDKQLESDSAAWGDDVGNIRERCELLRAQIESELQQCDPTV